MQDTYKIPLNYDPKIFQNAERYEWIRKHPAFETEAVLSDISSEDYDRLVDENMREGARE